MTDKEIKKLVDETVSKYSRKAWINPYHAKEYIPDENIPSLKKELFDIIIKMRGNK